MMLPRRTFLRGLGAALALPVMESLLPRQALAAFEQRPKRLGVFYFPNGMRMDSFTPAQSGRNYTLSPILESLSAVKDEFSVVTGLAHYNAQALGDPGGAHGRSCAAFLTGAHPKSTEGSDLFNCISLDQFVAGRLGGNTPFASLELGIEPSSLLGSCDIGFSCTYTNTLSWRSETQALPVMVNPRVVFERLFGDGSMTDEAARQRMLGQRASILDFVRDDAARLAGNLAANDRRKMDEYLTAVRETERRVQKLASQPLDSNNQSMALPAGIPDSFEVHVQLMIDLQILALQTEMTQVSTFMLGRELSNRTYPEIGVADSHHSLSHHAGNDEKIANLVKISQFHMSQFAYYLRRLRETPDGEGSLLDNSVILAGASLGEPNEHDCMDLPALVAGGGVIGNQHLQQQKHTPMCNLMVSLIQAMGIDADQFGDSTGAVAGLYG
jgi:hypothetical protein